MVRVARAEYLVEGELDRRPRHAKRLALAVRGRVQTDAALAVRRAARERRGRVQDRGRSKPFAKSDGKCTDAGSFEAVPLSCVSGHCWPAPDSPVRVSLPNSDEGFLEGAVPVTVVVLRRTSGWSMLKVNCIRLMVPGLAF